MTDVILSSRKDNIATITLNRPEKLNALNKPMWLRMGEVLEELSMDKKVRCIVLRGAGGKSFSPGADISEFATERSSPSQGKAYGKVLCKTIDMLRDCLVPTVAIIEGICVGGGLLIASCCDFRICGEKSRFGVPIKNLGLVMAYGELSVLVRLVGRATAMEILLEGRIFGAAEALDKGLVTRVVIDGKVEREGYATAERIAAGAPLVARWHKKFANRLSDPSPLTEAEMDECYACYGTEDFQHGYRSFLQKQKTRFKGQ
jgi:enoyl-CoA hydratase/carnithine racemase